MIKAFLGCSIDGYISTSLNEPARFSSKADLYRIREQLNFFDAVVMGKTTLDAYGSTLTPTESDCPQFIYTRQKNLDWSAYPKFQKQVSLCSTIQDLTFLKNSDVACLGGAKLVSDLISLKMLNFLNVTIKPITLKSGVKLSLPDVNMTVIRKLKIVGTDETNYTFRLNY